MRDSSVWAVMRLTPSFQSARSVPSRLGYLWYCRKLLFSVVLTSVICAQHPAHLRASAGVRHWRSFSAGVWQRRSRASQQLPCTGMWWGMPGRGSAPS